MKYASYNSGDRKVRKGARRATFEKNKAMHSASAKKARSNARKAATLSTEVPA